VSTLRIVAAIAAIGLLGACATTNQKYNWGKYDPSLYGYYKDPTKVGELNQTLAAIIDSAATGKANVPPGIYAEYGYLQLQAGKSARAIELFKQEEARWPESKVFMDRMIRVASTPDVGTNTPSSAP
jgi:hypothetical protein